jgi:hypothetical protein
VKWNARVSHASGRAEDFSQKTWEKEKKKQKEKQSVLF